MISILVKRLRIGNVEDPKIYLGAVVYDWLKTDHGKWCKKHAMEMVYHSSLDHSTMSYVYAITGLFSKEDAMIYQLKWGNNV